MNAIQNLVCDAPIDLSAVAFFTLVFLAMTVFFAIMCANSKGDDGLLYGILTGFFSVAAFITALAGLLQ